MWSSATVPSDIAVLSPLCLNYIELLRINNSYSYLDDDVFIPIIFQVHICCYWSALDFFTWPFCWLVTLFWILASLNRINSIPQVRTKPSQTHWILKKMIWTRRLGNHHLTTRWYRHTVWWKSPKQIALMQPSCL